MTASTSGSSGEDERKELLDLYKSAIEEYRFQVQLNWSRSQYLLAFNVAVVAAGAGLIKLGGSPAGVLTAGVFVVGAFSAVLSAVVTHVQHGYYRSTRGRMQRFEDKLAIPSDLRVDTTPAMGSRLKRIGRITTMLYLVFALTAILDVIGVGVAFDAARNPATETPKPSVAPSASATPSLPRSPTLSPSASWRPPIFK